MKAKLWVVVGWATIIACLLFPRLLVAASASPPSKMCFAVSGDRADLVTSMVAVIYGHGPTVKLGTGLSPIKPQAVALVLFKEGRPYYYFNGIGNLDDQGRLSVSFSGTYDGSELGPMLVGGLLLLEQSQSGWRGFFRFRGEPAGDIIPGGGIIEGNLTPISCKEIGMPQ